MGLYGIFGEMNAQERHSTAIHEAAHGVIARQLGLGVSKIEIYDPPKIERDLEHPSVIHGRTHVESAINLANDCKDEDTKLGALAYSMICRLAGPAASRVIGEDSGSSDYRAIFRPLGLAFDSGLFNTADDAATFAAEVKQLERLAEQLVADNWSSIKRVASALMDQGQVGQKELDRLCSQTAH